MDGMMSDLLNVVNSFLLIIWVLSLVAAVSIMKKRGGGIQPFILLLILITGPVGLIIWLFVINRLLD